MATGWTPRIRFVAGMQSGNHWLNPRLARWHTGADAFAPAGYFCGRLTGAEAARTMTGPEDLMRWMLATPIRRSLDAAGVMRRDMETIRASGKEAMIYEINNHHDPW